MEKKELQKGKMAPDICLPDQNGNEKCLKDLRGKWTVVYFYPKDNTPGCSREAVDFTSMKEEFEKLGAEILGISADSCESHRKFISKKELNLTLLSDPKKESLEKYSVLKQKKLYGKGFLGIERSTFLVNPDGQIENIWKKVKVSGHAKEVLEALKNAKNK